MTAAVRPHEQLLVKRVGEFVGQLPAGRVLCNTAGRGQFAAAFAGQHPAAQVTCWFLDLFQRDQALLAQSPPANLDCVCTADPPPDEVDLVAWCLGRQGDGELARETLQLGHLRLAIGGQMLVATDNPRDKWLQEQLQAIFPKVSRHAAPAGVVYRATKQAPLRKAKNYAAEFPFRDGDRLNKLRTRPGVFSHRSLDGGARALMKAMTVAPGMRVLDIGCGSGAVGVAAALRAGDIELWATDSNPRAIEAAAWAAEHNGVSSLTARLDADGSSVPAGHFDLVLANPPYYSNFRLAELFVSIAAKTLRPCGRLLLVTKSPDWYLTHLPGRFDAVGCQPVGNYQVVQGARR
jgi:16S rRNA (guanine1207-N2)-methyltransferase